MEIEGDRQAGEDRDRGYPPSSDRSLIRRPRRRPWYAWARLGYVTFDRAGWVPPLRRWPYRRGAPWRSFGPANTTFTGRRIGSSLRWTGRDNGVLLGAAMEEARLRNSAVQAIICRRTAPGNNGAADAEGNHLALADLERRLDGSRRRHPDLVVDSVAVRGSLLEYLANHCRSVRLVIVGARDHHRLGELVGPAGNAILQDADCSLLIVNRQHL